MRKPQGAQGPPGAPRPETFGRTVGSVPFRPQLAQDRPSLGLQPCWKS